MITPVQILGSMTGPPPSRGRGVGFPDSVAKLVRNLAALSPQPVTFQGKPVLPYRVERVTLGASMFREFICTPGCTACCLPFTIDYTPQEFRRLPAELRNRVPWAVREVVVNKKQWPVYSFNQALLPQCPYLTIRRPTGGWGCALWPRSPLECAAAPQLHFITRQTGSTHITKQPFSRAWRFAQKPQCQFISTPGPERLWAEFQKNIQLLRRYAHWAAYLEIPVCLDAIIAALHRGSMAQRAARGDGPALFVVWQRDRRGKTAVR